MQETPNYQNFKNQLDQLDLPRLLDQGSRVEEPHRSVIQQAYDKLHLYFGDDKYRATLTTAKKNNIEGQINNVLGQLNHLQNLQSTNPAQVNPEIENISNNIQSYLEDIDMRFYNPYQTYILQNGQEVGGIISDIRKNKNQAEKIRVDAEETLQSVNLLAGQGAASNLSNHYQVLANGLTSEDTENRRLDVKEISPKLIIGIVGAVGLLTFFAANEVASVIRWFSEGGTESLVRMVGALMLLLGALLYPILKYFKKYQVGGYDKAAALWFMGAVAAVCGTAIYAALLVHELGSEASWEQLIPKLVSLLAPAYFVRFTVQNYRANKHLSVLNTQKATVAQVASAFSKQVEESDPSLRREVLGYRAAILDKAASVVFEPGETGYLTTKEGAGSDSMFDGTPIDNRLIK